VQGDAAQAARDVQVLRIAGASIGLAATSRMCIAVGDAHRTFLGESDAPDIRLQADWADLSAGGAGEEIFDAGVWKLTRRGDEYVFRFFTPLCGEIPYKELVVGADYARGCVGLHSEFYAPERPVDPLEYPLDELLLVHYLAHRGGVVLHACGIVDESGLGYLFVGHSGAGKTTTALLWEGRPGVRVLSDDRIIVRHDHEGLLMHGTPWHGTGRLSMAASAPITAIFFLEHGEANKLSPVLPSVAVAELVARSFLAFHDRTGIDTVVALLGDVVSRVPCLGFSFKPDETAVETVRSWAERRADG
jgi:hypothetical protein